MFLYYFGLGEGSKTPTEPVVDNSPKYNPETDDKYPTYLKVVIGSATAVFL